MFWNNWALPKSKIFQQNWSRTILKKNSEQLEKFINTFDLYTYQFSSDLPPNQLFNITSGKAATPQVDEFLLYIEKIGAEQRNTFISECASDPRRFEKSIKKTPIHNFSCQLEKKKTIKIREKNQEIKLQRDLFGRLLGISMDHKIDVLKILSYPITPVPLALCHLDGGICKTDKSVLVKCLEPNIDHEPPHYADVFLIDGFFILHSMKEVPKTFGSISKFFLQIITKYSARRIDVIFDQYLHPSIKDNERCIRHEASLIDYKISGPDQVRPSDFVRELKNTKFKEALIEFFMKHWSSDEVRSFWIHLNFRNCQSYQIVNDIVQSNVFQDLFCILHEEADTKIIYHACNISEQSNIAIRASDTDILIIMISNMAQLGNYASHIWMLIGTGNKNLYIDITKIYEHLGESLAKSLIGFHAFTGCDFNPAFFNKEKQKPFTLLKKRVEFQQAFTALGEQDLTEDELQPLFNIIQQFTCQMYNAKKCENVDDGRFQLFVNSYKAPDVNENFSKKVHTFDASSIPPCKSELYQQFLRAHYISSTWRNAFQRQPTKLNPLEYGWINQDDSFVFKWFEGDQLPDFVSDLISDVPEVDSVDDEDQSHEEESNSEDDE